MLAMESWAAFAATAGSGTRKGLQKWLSSSNDSLHPRVKLEKVTL